MRPMVPWPSPYLRKTLRWLPLRLSSRPPSLFCKTQLSQWKTQYVNFVVKVYTKQNGDFKFRRTFLTQQKKHRSLRSRPWTENSISSTALTLSRPLKEWSGPSPSGRPTQRQETVCTLITPNIILRLIPSVRSPVRPRPFDSKVSVISVLTESVFSRYTRFGFPSFYKCPRMSQRDVWRTINVPFFIVNVLTR